MSNIASSTEVPVQISEYRAANVQISFSQDQFETFQGTINKALSVVRNVGEFVTAASSFTKVADELVEQMPGLFPKNPDDPRLTLNEREEEAFYRTTPGVIRKAAEKVQEFEPDEGIISLDALDQYIHNVTAFNADISFPYNREAGAVLLNAISADGQKAVISGYSKRISDAWGDRVFATIINCDKQKQRVKAYYKDDKWAEGKELKKIAESTIAILSVTSENPLAEA